MKLLIRQQLDEIAREVRNKVVAHGFNHVSMEISLDVSSSVLEKMDASQIVTTLKLPVTTRGVMDQIGWSCTLWRDCWSSTYPRITQVKEERLRKLIEDFAGSFRLLGFPIQYSQVGMYLQAAVFKSRFADHPNLVREHEIVQASLDIRGVHSVVIIGKIIDPKVT